MAIKIAKSLFSESMIVSALAKVSQSEFITQAVVFYQDKTYRRYKNQQINIDHVTIKPEPFVVFRGVCIREVIRVSGQKFSGLNMEISGSLRKIRSKLVGTIKIEQVNTEPQVIFVNEGFRNLLETGILLSSLTCTYKLVKVDSIKKVSPTPNEIVNLLQSGKSQWHEFGLSEYVTDRATDIKAKYFSHLYIPKGKGYRVTKALYQDNEFDYSS